jgi:hypothetical protein
MAAFVVAATAGAAADSGRCLNMEGSIHTAYGRAENGRIFTAQVTWLL